MICPMLLRELCKEICVVEGKFFTDLLVTEDYSISSLFHLFAMFPSACLLSMWQGQRIF